MRRQIELAARGGLARLLGLARLPDWLVALAAKAARRTDPQLSILETPVLRHLALSDDPAKRAMLFGRSRSTTPTAAIQAVDSVALVGVAAALFGMVEAEPGERSKVLHQFIALDRATSAARQHAALVCVRRHTNEIVGSQAKAILDRCLVLGSQPIDPYDPSPLHMAARMAAAALLEHDPSLDTTVLGQLDRPQVALVYAAALQRRSVRFGEAVAAGLTKMKPGEQRAIGFARDCDRKYSALDSVEPGPTLLDRGLSKVRRGVGRFVVLIHRPARLAIAGLLVAVFVGAAFAIDAWLLDLPDDVQIGTAAALTALGVLVAVHIVAAELAAERLAGPIARATSFPISLQGGYLAAGALLILSGVSRSRSNFETLSILTVGLVVGLVGLLVSALVTLLARTDPVQAVEAFSRRQRATLSSAGRALGRLQSRALRQRELFAGFAWTRDGFGPPLGEQRVQISARRPGYLLLRERRLLRLSRRAEYRSENLKVAMVAVIGLPVSPNDEVFSLIPSGERPPTRADVKRVARLPRIREHRAIDRAAEYVGTMLGIAETEAAAGNVAGAERVRNCTLEAVSVHLSATRRARHSANLRDPIGLVPALRTSAVQGVRALARVRDANAHEIVIGFLQRLLARTDLADGFAAMLAAQVARSELPEGDRVQLLWDCGVRALEVGDQLGLRQVREAVERLPQTPRRVELGGRLVQFAALARPGRAEELWQWHARSSREIDRFQLTALRVGASALSVGFASLAVIVALDLRQLDVAGWIEYFERDTVAESEKLVSDLHGQLLGADPQVALLDFVRFVERAVSAVTADPPVTRPSSAR